MNKFSHPPFNWAYLHDFMHYYRTYFDGQTATVKIYEAHRDHEGFYTCKFLGQDGSVETSARLTIEGKAAFNHLYEHNATLHTSVADREWGRGAAAVGAPPQTPLGLCPEPRYVLGSRGKAASGLCGGSLRGSGAEPNGVQGRAPAGFCSAAPTIAPPPHGYTTPLILKTPSTVRP